MYSEHPGKEFGKFKLTAGAFYNDAEEDKGEPPFYFYRYQLDHRLANSLRNKSDIHNRSINVQRDMPATGKTEVC